jgi:hypothetical protein
MLVSAFHAKKPQQIQSQWIKASHDGEEKRVLSFEEGQDSMMRLAHALGAGPQVIRDMKRLKLARKYNELAKTRMANA